MKIYAMTQKGQQKNENEDRILIGNHIICDGYSEFEMDNGTIAVSDGVGGNNAGATASDFIVSKLSECGIVTRESILHINEELINLSLTSPRYNNMAATLSGVVFNDKNELFHVGNTRIYILQGSSYLKQITEDHTTVNWLLKTGKITEAEAEVYDRRNEITACFGGGNRYLANQFHFEDECEEIAKTNTVIITSDGIHDYISIDDFEGLLSEDKEMRVIFTNIVNKAIDNGSADDKSIVVVRKRL